MNGCRDRAVRKANRTQLLNQYSTAAWLLNSDIAFLYRFGYINRESAIEGIQKLSKGNRVLYACLMTAFGF